MDSEEVVWKNSRAVTLKHVARAVGVSESLVSHVLNNSKSGTRVSAATRAAVETAARQMGYRPNANAKSLNTGRSFRIGVYSGRLTLDSRNAFIAEILGGIFDGAREHAMNTVMHTSGDGQRMLLELVSNRAADGLIVYAQPKDPILPLLGELRVPAVAIADEIVGLPFIGVDDYAGGRMQAEHLHSLGHRHALYRYPLTAPHSAIERLRGFLDAAHELGLRTTVQESDTLRPLGVTPEDIAQLSGDDRATALVGWNDSTAMSSWKSMLDLGISVPNQVSIIGFDGFESSRRHSENLTSIAAPWAEVGLQAARTLVNMIAGKPVAVRTILPVQLHTGGTTNFVSKTDDNESVRQSTGGQPS